MLTLIVKLWKFENGETILLYLVVHLITSQDLENNAFQHYHFLNNYELEIVERDGDKGILGNLSQSTNLESH